MSKGTNSVIAGFFFAMGATVAYQLLTDNQKKALKNKIQEKTNQAQEQVQATVNRVQENFEPYVDQAKKTLATRKEQLINQANQPSQSEQADIEINEDDLSLHNHQ